jgi:hypothetical protein
MIRAAENAKSYKNPNSPSAWFELGEEERQQNYGAAIKDHNVALVLKGQPVRAKPRRSLTSEIIGKIYNFFTSEIAKPFFPRWQQKLQAVQESIAKNWRRAVEKTKTKKKK